MHGGGSGEFSALAYNFVGAWVARKHAEIGSTVPELKSAVKNLKMDYIITGTWSQKAAAEAERLFGSEHVNVVEDSRKMNDGKFGMIPDEGTWNLSHDAAMVYYCDNETVEGVEFAGFPKSLEPGLDGPIVVADMSSNILSRTIPIKNFSAIFFGAQKKPRNDWYHCCGHQQTLPTTQDISASCDSDETAGSAYSASHL